MKLIYRIRELNFNTRIKIYREYRNYYCVDGKLKIIGVDIFGGIFSVNKQNVVYYFPPDSIEWENLDVNGDDFFDFMDDITVLDFYSDLLNDEIIDLVRNVKKGDGLLLYPFAFTNEFNLNTSSKKVVNLYELIKLYGELRVQINCIN